jgi:hypothetical protein
MDTFLIAEDCGRGLAMASEQDRYPVGAFSIAADALLSLGGADW